jgi:hypothetical protein
MPHFSLQKGKKEIKMAEEYCWVITLVVSRSCCHAVTYEVPVFWSFNFNWTPYTYTVEHMDTQFCLAQN